jgi:hypothetical protein
MITLILANIIWMMYSMLEGLREGFYWHFKSTSKRDCKFEIHPIFALQRGLVLLIIGGLLYYTIGIYSLTSIIDMALIFSFFHNGTYYYTRNKLDNNLYQLKWKDQSTTSTAKLTKIMTYRNRTIFMVLGVLLEVFIYIFLI